MGYTPELSDYHSSTLRRVAWALGKPMTKTIDSLFDSLDRIVDPGKVCESRGYAGQGQIPLRFVLLQDPGADQRECPHRSHPAGRDGSGNGRQPRHFDARLP